jgi:anti-sigma B factor antagonist
MEIHVNMVRRISVVEIIGELDGKTASEAEEQILVLVQPGCQIVLDMTQVTYMSSTGLRLLLLLHRKVSSNNGHIAMLGLSEELREIMDITGFLNHFATDETLEAVLAPLAQ